MQQTNKKRIGFSRMESDIIRGAENNDLSEVQTALQRDWRDINKQDVAFGLTALHIAAAKGNLSMVKFLLEQREADTRLKDRLGRDSLDVAITAGHQGIIDALFRFRAEQSNASEPADDAEQRASSPRVVPFRPK